MSKLLGYPGNLKRNGWKLVGYFSEPLRTARSLTLGRGAYKTVLVVFQHLEDRINALPKSRASLWSLDKVLNRRGNIRHHRRDSRDMGADRGQITIGSNAVDEGLD